ncbi:MAG: hypothetical protein NZ807_13965 [Dehalococcoidia bacterium]|nr:hypothetical protein [Dehalococcoidia bacterium]
MPDKNKRSYVFVVEGVADPQAVDAGELAVLANMYMRTVLFLLVYTYMCIPR